MSGISNAEIVDELSRWSVGGGIVTMVLFPLALPILVLTAIAAIPLLLIALVGALAAAAIIVAVSLLRRLGRRVMRARRPSTAVRPLAGS